LRDGTARDHLSIGDGFSTHKTIDTKELVLGKPYTLTLIMQGGTAILLDSTERLLASLAGLAERPVRDNVKVHFSDNYYAPANVTISNMKLTQDSDNDAENFKALVDIA